MSNDPDFVAVLRANHRKATEAKASERAARLHAQIAYIDKQLVKASNAGVEYLNVSEGSGYLSEGSGYFIDELKLHYNKIGLITDISGLVGRKLTIQFM
jgi:hypothetical protein